ncbi:MAG: hypothetical protein IAG13_15460 [Deltaproteobacteria bacterium]|nr:hypothetical protein [Nannocystaceae bacterium]
MKPFRSALALAALLVACNRQAAPANPPSETPPANTEAKAEPSSPHDAAKPFHELDKDGKMQRMAKVVMPDMGPVFKGFDAERYAKFDCGTCHVNHVHHPKDGLPKLALSNGGYEKLVAEKPELMKFMAEQVVPNMAKAMAEPVYDPATGQGFGCGGCHTVE